MESESIGHQVTFDQLGPATLVKFARDEIFLRKESDVPLAFFFPWHSLRRWKSFPDFLSKTESELPLPLHMEKKTELVDWDRHTCSVPRAYIPLFSLAFLASVHHPSHMAHVTIAVRNLGPDGLSWNWCIPAASARFPWICCLHSGHHSGCVISCS